jgi:hypothetical protein
MRAVSGLVLIALTGLAGCDSGPSTLIVELRTDYRPGVDFGAVRVELVGARAPISNSVTAADDFTTQRRIAELNEVPAGSYELSVSLLTAIDGDVVAGRLRPVTVDGATAVVIEILSGVDGGVDGCIPDERGEVCNGADDDCDSVIDEGHDLDEDGFTWCGGGVADQADCDDGDPNAHPGTETVEPATEICDGADNDCDGSIDEDDGSGVLCSGGLVCVDRICTDAADCSQPSVTCPSGTVCDFAMTPPACVSGACPAGGCPAGQICNSVTGECVTPAAIGEACNTDEDCAGGICVSGEAAGATLDRLCSRSCCNDGDCPSGAVCAATGTGVLLCLPGGPALSSAPGCGSDMDCTDPEKCVVEVLPSDVVVTTCGEPGGPIGQGEADLLDEGCASRISEGVACSPTLECGPVCVGTCSTSADCPTSIPDTEFYCGSVEVTGYDGPVRVCTIKRHAGTGATGAACSTNASCRDLTCVGDRCADSCCSDGDCTDPGTRCRPLRIRGHWETHCVQP